MYLSALPKISEDFSTSANLVQLTITTWLAGDTFVQLIVGPLADRYGRRFILFGGGLLFVVSTLGCALAPSIGFLLVFRFIQGIGVCTMMIAGYASIHDLYDDQRAIHILVWMGSAAIIAPAIGPVLGGVILTFADWRAIFYFLFALAIVSLIFLWFVMPESLASDTKHPLHVRALIYSYKKIITNPSFMISAASFGLLYGGIMGWITTSPFLLMNTLHLTPLQFGWLQVPVFGAYIVGAQLVKPLMEKIGKDKLIIFGLSIASLAGLGWLLLPFLYPEKIVSFILPMVGYTLGFGFAAAPLNRTTLTEAQEKKGTAIAVFYLMMVGLGTIISLILSVFDENAFSISIVIATSVFLAFVLNAIRQKRDQK
jgi:DHA1 family multidrug/chloramphenicol efflux transport protein-like MFS transporter